MHTEDDRRDASEQPFRSSRHETHRDGPYFGIDAEADVEYGDGTAQWLSQALRRRPRDSWRAERDSWHAVHQSWATDGEDAEDVEDTGDLQDPEDRA